MDQYILLLHECPSSFASIAPEQVQAIIARYKAWGERLREAGRLAGSQKLEHGTGRMLQNQNGEVKITDGPFTETKDIVGGYFIIQAQSYDEAAALSSDCPHLELGGTIELRRVDQV
jgi:hypothetical protein